MAMSETTETAPMIICSECGTAITDGTEERVNYRTYCRTCYEDNFSECQWCNDVIANDDLIEYHGDSICQNCYDNRDYEDSEDSIDERDYSKMDLPKFQSDKAGEIITSPRIFSAEIEAYYGDSGDIESASQLLAHEIGITSDGSLNCRGIEFQTPKLKGEAGEQAIKKMCKVLNSLDFTNDRTTGLHIHLDSADMKPKTITRTEPKAIKACWIFYLLYEEVILSFLPPSRRRNSYCKLIKEGYHITEIEGCNNIAQLEKLWYRTQSRKVIKDRKAEKYDGSRYAGANFHSLLANGHLEIRYHSGTINAEKILEWVNLHQTIMDKALWNYTAMTSKKIMGMPELKEKTALFYEILELPKRAQKYFSARQKMFSSTKSDKDEQVNEAEPCAG